jgi:RNA polymerase sigma-70 factor (ECF subfamily)
MMELESLVTDLAPQLLRYCMGRTGKPDVAEEIAQEALSALVQRWRRAGPPDNPAAFVFTIARRRSARMMVRQRLLVPLETLVNRSDGSRAPGDAALHRSELAVTRRALGRLSARDREVLLLVAAGELDLKTVAQLLGISLSAVKMRLSRARQRLTALVEVAHEPS